MEVDPSPATRQGEVTIPTWGESTVRRFFKVVIPATAAVLMATTLPAGAASAAPTVPGPLFGQHVAGIASGAPAGLKLGAVRIWDSGVSWRDLQPAPGTINLEPLKAAVANAQKAGATEIMYTLGNTPKWAASDPNSKLGLYGPGSNSHPARNSYYTDFLKAVATQVPGITSFQVWNEANLKDFYLGTPAQMAQLTKDARAALNSVGSGAALVAASTTVRAKGPVGKFGKAYGAAMRKAGAWGAVNAVSAHFYPPAKQGPATRVRYIKTVKKYYKRYGAGRKPLWDTEMNYGDMRSYMKVKRQYTGDTAATFVARTYLDSMRYGVYRVFWYGWDMNVLGTDMTSRGDRSTTSGGRAFLEIQEWMVGKTWLGCKVKSSITTCTLRAPNGQKQTIRYAAKAKSVKVPAGATVVRRLDGTTGPGAGSTIRLTSMPVMIEGA
jgi:hypothetical protein